MLDLQLNARPDEKFHLQTGQPMPEVLNLWVMKRVIWHGLFLPDSIYDGVPYASGELHGSFTSWWWIGNAVHYYLGNCKCDGSRTVAYWRGQLDNGKGKKYKPDPSKYVMCTTEKEKRSVRFFIDPGEPVWSNMGGS